MMTRRDLIKAILVGLFSFLIPVKLLTDKKKSTKRKITGYKNTNHSVKAYAVDDKNLTFEDFRNYDLLYEEFAVDGRNYIFKNRHGRNGWASNEEMGREINYLIRSTLGSRKDHNGVFV